jgi:hypothetical protein
MYLSGVCTIQKVLTTVCHNVTSAMARRSHGAGRVAVGRGSVIVIIIIIIIMGGILIVITGSVIIIPIGYPFWPSAAILFGPSSPASWYRGIVVLYRYYVLHLSISYR